MFTMRELQRRATVVMAVAVLMAVPLACPLTKVVMDWQERRKQAGPDHGGGQTPSVA